MKRLKGLYKDSLPIDQPEGTYRHAENVNLNMDIGSIASEAGIELSTTMASDFIPLAYEVSPDKRLIIWYVTDATCGIGELKDGTFTPIIEDTELFFTSTSKIQTTSRLDKEGSLLVYWTDGVNSPRFYNIDEQPSYVNINELNIFDFISSIGRIYLDQVQNAGGSLWSGSYVFAMRYIDEDDNKSNFFDITRPINIIRDSDTNFVEGSPTVRTSKSIQLQLDNLDDTFDYAEIAAIRFEGSTIAEVTLLPKIVIDSSSGIINYGGNSLGRDISLEEVTINKVSYTSAKAMTQLDGVLYMGNLVRSEEIDYQRYANNIKTYLVKKNISELDHGDEDNAFYSMSFRRGEVYAFYISFVLKDGTETEAFHIPGREAVGNELTTVDTSDIGDNKSYIGSGMQRFQLYSKSDPVYGMGYWHNNALSGSVYPSNPKFDIIDIDSNGDETQVGTLRGQSVRHHRFPDEISEPVVQSVNGRTATVSVLGVRFQNIKIPQEIKDRIKGVKFYYAQKNESNRINIDEGFAVGQDVLTSGSQWNIIEETEVYRNRNLEVTTGSYNYHAISLLPFSSLLSRTGLSGIDYVLKTRTCVTSWRDKHNTHDHVIHANKVLPVADTDASRDNDFGYIKAIDAISYYDSNEVSIALQNFGFPYNKSSYIENSGIIINGAGGYTFPIDYSATLASLSVGQTSSAEDTFGCVYSMCKFKTNIHHPFSQESLVSMGKLDINLNNYDPTHGSYIAGATQDFYSGDTFINRIGHLVSYDRGIGGEELSQALIYTVVQSYDNIAWRQSGEDQYDFNPNNTDLEGDILDAYRDTIQDEFFDNYYGYDQAHSVSAYLKTTVPDQSVDKLTKRLPTRVIRSAEQNPESNEDSFRTFLENDYLDLPSNRGDINKLATNNSILIVHTENSLFRTRGREELATGDFRAFLGSGDIFEVQPTEIFNTKHGFAGLQDVNSAIETRSGYFFVDSFNRRPYLLSDGIEDLAEKGMRNFFNENLEWFIDQAQDHTDIEHVGISAEYDERYNRILLTKVDYQPTQALLDGLGSTISFNSSTGKFNNGSDIEYTNQTFFTDKSFTLSYLPEIGAWVSFHSYKPLFYMSDGFNLFSFKDNFYRHNSIDVDYMNYYGTQHSMHFQFVDNREPLTSKHLTNIEFITHALSKADNHHVWDKTFDRLQVRNSKQDSDILPLVYFTSPGGNIRNVEGTWRVNKLRDLIDPATGEVDPSTEWFNKKNFIGKYALIDLYYDTPDNTKLSLVSATANFKESIR